MSSASTRALRAVLPFVALVLLAPTAAHAQRCTPGATLDVESSGTYYPATVKRGPDGQGRCFIGYDGYAANWDEWVTPARMRARAAGQGAAAAPAPGAQATLGAQYGSREPRPCPTVKATANRPPDAATAAAAVTCKKEGVVIGSLYLISNVRIQVGGGQPYRDMGPRDREGLSDADVTATVYTIRGSYTSYLCNRVGSSYPAGQNCNRYESTRTQGQCYRNNFGEWSCDIGGGESSEMVPNQPPPRN